MCEDLQEAALAGEEVLGRGARERVGGARLLTAGLREQRERAPRERLIGTPQEGVRGTARLTGRGGGDRVHRVGHGRAVRIGARRVVVERGGRRAGRHRPLQRIHEQHGVGLLDRGAVVTVVLEEDLALRVVRDAQAPGDVPPPGRCGPAQCAGGVGCGAQRGGGDGVGVGAVGDAVAVLVGTGHLVDGVRAVRVPRHP